MFYSHRAFCYENKKTLFKIFKAILELKKKVSVKEIGKLNFYHIFLPKN